MTRAPKRKPKPKRKPRAAPVDRELIREELAEYRGGRRAWLNRFDPPPAATTPPASVAATATAPASQTEEVRWAVIDWLERNEPKPVRPAPGWKVIHGLLGRR